MDGMTSAAVRLCAGHMQSLASPSHVGSSPFLVARSRTQRLAEDKGVREQICIHYDVPRRKHVEHLEPRPCGIPDMETGMDYDGPGLSCSNNPSMSSRAEQGETARSGLQTSRLPQSGTKRAASRKIFVKKTRGGPEGRVAGQWRCGGLRRIIDRYIHFLPSCSWLPSANF